MLREAHFSPDRRYRFCLRRRWRPGPRLLLVMLNPSRAAKRADRIVVAWETPRSPTRRRAAGVAAGRVLRAPLAGTVDPMVDGQLRRGLPLLGCLVLCVCLLACGLWLVPINRGAVPSQGDGGTQRRRDLSKDDDFAQALGYADWAAMKAAEDAELSDMMDEAQAAFIAGD